MISQVEFLITETVISFRRHPTMAFAAITCVAAALFVAGLVGLGILNAHYAVNTAIDRVRFTVFFQPETTREEAKTAYHRIGDLPGVAEVEFISREEGLRRMLQKEPELKEYIRTNPLPDAVVVKAASLRAIPGLMEQLNDWPEVDIVKDAPEVNIALEHISSGVSRVGLIVGLILAALSLVIIHHTIELTLYARRREIFIMSLVGATPTTIAMPFLLEGIIYGLIGAGVALGCLSALYKYFVESAWHSFHTRLLDSSLIMWHGAAVLLAVGMVLGLFGSLFSVLKYLNRPRSKMTNA